MLLIGLKTDDTAGAAGQVNAAEFNSGSQESQNAVLKSGQVLSGANLTQVSQAMAITGGAASSCIDSGTANSVILTPTTGANGILIPTTYDLFNGWEVYFYIKETNTGNVTINIGQTVGIGIKKLLRVSGAEISAGLFTAGQLVRAIYDINADSSAGAWVVDESIVLPVGVGQSWIDVTGSRALTATYTNTKGRPIQLSVSVQIIGGAASLDVSGGIIGNWLNNDGVNAQRFTTTPIIPNLGTYTMSGGTLISWFELN